MLVGFAEGLGAAKTYAVKAGYDIDSNRELVGLGAANLGSGWPAAWSSTAASPRRPSTADAGAKSQLSGVTAAVLTIVTLLFLTGLFEQLPEATLAAVVIGAVDRARRHRVASSALPGADRSALLDLPLHQPGRLHRRDRGAARCAALRHAPWARHRYRRLAGAAGRADVAPARCGARPGARCRRTCGSTRTATRRRPGRRRSSWCVSRLRCSSATPTSSASSVRALAADTDGIEMVVIDAETSPSLDVSCGADARAAARRPRARRGETSPSPTASAQVRDVLCQAGIQRARAGALRDDRRRRRVGPELTRGLTRIGGGVTASATRSVVSSTERERHER